MTDRPRRVILPHFTRSILMRSLLVWAFVRIAASAGIGAAGAALGLRSENPLHLNPFAAAFVLVIVAVAGLVSMRRRNEDTFLLCLGYGRAQQAAMFTGPAAVLEIVLGLMAP